MTKKRVFSVGPGVECDIERLVNSRLLLQAASGAGKSWALRRLLEQTFGSVQQLVIDPEGEFASLREKFDYVLAARQGGDTLADPRTAKLLAERLLELGASAILDISELKAHERIAFVKLFMDAVVEAPKALWHPCLVVLDEAQMFCPEGSDADSADAVTSLATRGRKRGFCLVAATQRLSSLSKNVAAQLSNKLIGRTSLDVDVKRAAYELGFSTQEERRALRDLEDGEFFAFGPALTKTVEKVKVGTVQTEHPKAGSARAAVVPPPPERIKALLPKLSDLPAEAEAREKSVADLKRELANTRRELTEVRKAQPPAPKTELKRVEVLTDADRALLEKTAKRITDIEYLIRQGRDQSVRALTDKWKQLDEFWTRRVGEVLDAKGFQKILGKLAAVSPESPVTSRQSVASGLSRTPNLHVERRPVRPPTRQGPGDDSLPSGERMILTAIGQYADGVDRSQLSILTGYKRSTRDRYLQFLGQKGFVDVSGDRILPTPDGMAALGDFEPLPTGDALLAHWMQKLPEGEARVLRECSQVFPKAADREAISSATGYKRSTRDRYIQFLQARKLVTSTRDGVLASAELFS